MKGSYSTCGAFLMSEVPLWQEVKSARDKERAAVFIPLHEAWPLRTSTLGLRNTAPKLPSRVRGTNSSTLAVLVLIKAAVRRSNARGTRSARQCWREAGPPNHHDDKVDSDWQEVKSARDKERAAVFIPPKERSKDKKKNKVSSLSSLYYFQAQRIRTRQPTSPNLWEPTGPNPLYHRDD